MHTSDYYRERYKGVERAVAFVHWLGHWAQRLAWGYGLRLKNLSLNIAILILAISFVIYSCGSTYNVGGIARALSFSEAMYVTIITFCTVGFGDITPAAFGGRVIASVTAVFGVIAWGFFVAAIYRRLAK
jgi:hypothetical protein